MGGEGDLVHRQGPDAQVVNLVHAGLPGKQSLDLAKVDAVRLALHQYREGLAQDGHRGQQNQYREQEGAERIRNPVLGLQESRTQWALESEDPRPKVPTRSRPNLIYYNLILYNPTFPLPKLTSP